MSENELIVRIAAKGDGVTASGLHVSGAAPGDTVNANGIVMRGEHYVAPLCKHFERCGGCELQHCDDASLAEFVRNRVLFAAESHGLAPLLVTAAHLSPPQSRRRATLHAVNGGGGKAMIGFLEAGSHRVVGLSECHILAPEIFGLVGPLGAWLSKRKGKYSADIDVALVDQGVDCAIRNIAVEGLEQIEDLLDFCRDNGVARLGLDQGYGPETFWEPEPVTVTLGGMPVAYPVGSFLQATADGEAALVSAVTEWLDGCANVADLFSGLGTFAFALGRQSQVAAFEAARDAVLACKSANRGPAKSVETHHRDLFRNPLRPAELSQFDGVVLDPPRAGARSQVEQLAQANVSRIAYVSCNPLSWARDGALLIEAGYKLAEVRPVGQFRWSTHVELASLFVKDGE